MHILIGLSYRTAIEYLNAGRSPVALEDFSLVDFKPR